MKKDQTEEALDTSEKKAAEENEATAEDTSGEAVTDADEAAGNQEEQAEQTAEEKLENELADMKDKYLRLMAEYDNYRKRTAKQILETTQNAKGNTINEILPVYDNFERAASAESADETYKSGVEMIFNQFGEMLKKLGVEVINPVGEKFDPNIANAVNQIEDPDLGDNVVAQVFQKGYKIGDKVLRYAMVVVANP